MMANASTQLLSRVRSANDALASLASGKDQQLKLQRGNAQAAELRDALRVLQAGFEAASELNEHAEVQLSIPRISPPVLGEATPLEWFDSGAGIEYIRDVKRKADRLLQDAIQAWSEVRTQLEPSLLDADMIERLRGNTPELDEACEKLAAATSDWRQLPARLPANGDVERARRAKARIDAGWEALERAGATEDRIAFLKRVGTGRVPLTLLTDDLLVWLRRTGLAASLVVTST